MEKSGSRRLAKLLSTASAAALLLSACGSASSAASSSSSASGAASGGSVTYAFGPNYFKWILPIPNEVSWTQYQQAVEYSLWAPLYETGAGSSPTVNEAVSIAEPPVFSNNNTTVTVKLKPGWTWSNGQPVTTNDVKFFFQLFDANKTSVASYVPGNFPDNITSVDYPSSSEFVIHLNGSYSQQWVADNELTNIIPLPTYAWDRTSMTGPVGNNAATPAGAKAVFNFLTKQSETLSTYSTNPLWKAIDGAWSMTAYDPTTSRVVLTANPKYTGPQKPHLHQVIIQSFASDAAEVDALRSGTLDYGFLPYSEYLGLKGYFQSNGYTVAPWIPDFVEWGVVNYTGPYAALDSQLYIRQALQHLINQPLYIKTVLHGIGVQTYGPVPNSPGSPFISPQEKTDPYPYSVTSARQLLTSHGWQPNSSGVMTCQSPGTGASQCGQGISAGQQLVLSLLYVNTSPTLTAEVQAFQTAAKSAGISITFNPQSTTSVYTLGGLCPTSAPCNWAIKLFPNWLWNYGDLGTFPSGGQQWSTGNYWGGGYSSPTADALIKATHTQSGTAALFTYENYISKQVAALWFPTWATQISVVKNTLKGWQPQQVFGFPNWSNWTVS